jgi:hypothetical protein
VDKASAAIVLLAILLQGCATSHAARAARAQRDLQHAVSELEKRTDADSLAAAGLMSRFQAGPGVSLAMIGRATSVAPQRADLAWLDIQACQQAPGCDPESRELRLRTLDPANGAAWLNALARAGASNDEVAATAALADLARTQRVDTYWTSLVVHLTGALAATGDVPLRDALVDVIGVLAAQSMPGYRSTSELCLGQRLANVERLEACRGVASAFELGDTYITAMIGAVIAKRVWPADSAQWRAADESRRVYEYRSQLWTQWEAALLRDPQRVKSFLTLCARNRREQDVYSAELIDEGKNPDPPPDWKPRSR